MFKAVQARVWYFAFNSPLFGERFGFTPVLTARYGAGSNAGGEVQLFCIRTSQRSGGVPGHAVEAAALGKRSQSVVALIPAFVALLLAAFMC
jgi:hypothetical protein